jgi:predicted nucleic acid-binding protein
MPFLLDTNAWIGHLRQTSPAVTHHLSLQPSSDVVLCSVVLGGLLFGGERSGPVHRAANLALVAALRQQYISLPFDDRAASRRR